MTSYIAYTTCPRPFSFADDHLFLLGFNPFMRATTFVSYASRHTGSRRSISYWLLITNPTWKIGQILDQVAWLYNSDQLSL
ncbi:hypothetical protein Hanom_Chr12g01164341 [Helianthus anomalus]